MRKALAIGIASCFSMSVAAQAADLDRGEVQNVAPYSWAGLYAGGSVGLARGENTQTLTQEVVFFNGLTLLAGGESSGDLDGAVYGAHVGYVWQFDRIVIGLEGAFNGANIDDCPDLCDDTGIATRTKLDWYATAVARLGYAEGNWLFYGFGGIAWAKAGIEATDNSPVFDSPLSQPTISNIHGGDTDHVGWTAGIGVEYALSDRFTLRAEYAHVDLGEESLSLGSRSDVVSWNYYDVKSDLSFDVIKIGASYKLSDPEGGLDPLK